MSLKHSARRTWSQAYRAFLAIKADNFRLLDVSIWPIVVFLTTTLFAKFVSSDTSVIGMIVLGALGWRILYHFQMEPAQGLMDEYWANSLEQLMISPIRPVEMLLGGFISALVKSIIVSCIFFGLGAWLFSYYPTDIPLIIMGLAAIIVCGIIFAMFSLGTAILKGDSSYGFLFAVTDVVAVVSGVFYPLSVFPPWFRAAAQVLPTTQAFEMLKASVGFGEVRLGLFLITATLWFITGVLFLRWAIRKARREGRLIRMK